MINMKKTIPVWPQQNLVKIKEKPNYIFGHCTTNKFLVISIVLKRILQVK